VLVLRPESGVFYFNMDHVRDTVLERVRRELPPPALVVLDFSAAPSVDMHAAHMLEELAGELRSAGGSDGSDGSDGSGGGGGSGAHLQVVEARASVRDRLRNEGVDDALGGVNRFTSVADALNAFGREVPDPPHGAS
jgi:MFS superfamily sulfate permease-like transporter